jgi:dienelactone hydrolase
MAEEQQRVERADEPRESQDALRRRVAELVDFSVPSSAPDLQVLEARRRDGYSEQLVRFISKTEADIPALLLVPKGDGPFPAVVAYHQHHSQWHLGKSEVAGLAGDPDQALGPVLARHGVVVLAPDAVGFEDRRRSRSGTVPDVDDERQYYNEMAYRLLNGELLMSAILADGAQAVSALWRVRGVDRDQIGVVGHSMGGSTALFHAALDERLRFACASGAAATYRAKIAAGTGIEASLVIPGIRKVADIDDIATLIAPRPLLLVSATEDPYSQDADQVAERARGAYAVLGAGDALNHERFPGGHALTNERVALIRKWVLAQTHS